MCLTTKFLSLNQFKEQVDGLLKPEEIRYIRKNILKLTQEEAGLIFGGGKNGFSRYERGKTKPLPAISNCLKLLERHPEEINYLRSEKIFKSHGKKPGSTKKPRKIS